MNFKTDDPPIQKWEYKTLYGDWRSYSVTDDDLNALGKQGWELVTTGASSYRFKRPLPPYYL